MALHSSITLTSLILSDSAASILASPPPTPASAAACSLSQGACSAETGRLTAASTTRLWTRSLASLLLAALLVHVHVSGELSPRMYLGAYGGLVYAALVECCMRAGNRPVDLAVLMRQVGRASGRLAAVVVVVLGGGGSSAALAMAALVHLVRVCSVVAGPGRAASFLGPLLGSDAYRQVLDVRAYQCVDVAGARPAGRWHRTCSEQAPGPAKACLYMKGFGGLSPCCLGTVT